VNPTIIVGIPTWREADNIAQVVTQIDHGLERMYGANSCLIVNVDNESDDGTKDVFLGTKTACPKQYVSTGNNPRGKGKNLLCLLNMSLKAGAQYVATIDADVVTVAPEWPTNLLEPLISRGVDYTTPIYTRNRFEGSTTNHFAFPLLYGVYGAYVRQPIGGEFGISRKLVEYLVQQEVIPTTEKYGVDIFVTCHSVGGGFTTQEVFLGRKLHKPSFPKIISIFSQVAFSALHVAHHYRDRLTKPIAANIIGTDLSGIDAEQKPPPADAVIELVLKARDMILAQAEQSKDLLGRQLHNEMSAAVANDEPDISPELWARFLAVCVHQALQEKLTVSQLEQLVQGITPIFLCRSATLWRRADGMEPAAVEWEIRNQAELFRREIALLRR
jgi:glucosylglycerate synthase